MEEIFVKNNQRTLKKDSKACVKIANSQWTSAVDFRSPQCSRNEGGTVPQKWAKYRLIITMMMVFSPFLRGSSFTVLLTYVRHNQSIDKLLP